MSAVDFPSAASARDRRAGVAGLWSSRLGFILAAAGSAVGLGNIWKFPYITGMNGGGWFVVAYLLCIALVAAPILLAEILLGRATRQTPVRAFQSMAPPGGRWGWLGWLALSAAFLILSYYFVVAGWTLRYAWLAVSGQLFAADGAAAFGALFHHVYGSPWGNLSWQLAFVLMTAAVVLGGIVNGIERACRVLLPLLLVMLLALLAQVWRGPGWEAGLDFVFGLHPERFTAAGLLEALGHSFFTLSLGMGAMLTYGSYLARHEDAVAASAAVAGIDTLVSLLACAIVFPLIFGAGLAADAGPGLLFVSLPTAFAQLPGGAAWAALFFVLLVLAALSSTVALLEVVVGHLCATRGWQRARACAVSAAALLITGVPAALSGGTRLFGSGFEELTRLVFGTGRNWFDFVDYVATNWLLPIGGLGIAVFFAWRVGGHAREAAFRSGTRFGRFYWTWVWALRYLAPPAVVAVFAHGVGII